MISIAKSLLNRRRGWGVTGAFWRFWTPSDDSRVLAGSCVHDVYMLSFALLPYLAMYIDIALAFALTTALVLALAMVLILLPILALAPVLVPVFVFVKV